METKTKVYYELGEGIDFEENKKNLWEKSLGIEIKKSISTFNSNDTFSEFIMQLLLDKRIAAATETIVEEFLIKFIVYTIRSDDKPQMWIYEKGIYIPEAKTYIQQYCREILKQAYKQSLVNTVISKIEASTYIDQETFFAEQDPFLIPVENGLLHLKTKELKQYNPNLFFFNKLPVEFDSDAEFDPIEAFFHQVLPDDADVLVMQELFGYLLLRKYKHEKAFMFTGNGRNGKGKTVELMKRLLGIDNCSNVSLQRLETDNFAMSELFKKMANLSADLSRGALNNTGNFKSLTGQDLITAPRKFLTSVNFNNYAKMVFCANELPITRDLSEGFFDRWIIFDFPFKFLPKEQIKALEEFERANVFLADVELIDKLTTSENLSGLLLWSIIGLERLENNKGFSYSKGTTDIKNLWINKSDSFMGFCQTHIKNEFDGVILKRDLRKAYSEFCRRHKVKVMGDKHIKRIMEEIGASPERRLLDDNQEYVWIDVSWIDDKNNTYFNREVKNE